MCDLYLYIILYKCLYYNVFILIVYSLYVFLYLMIYIAHINKLFYKYK